MRDGPLVSIVTPTYNRPDKITDAIDEVAKQSYTNLQHIIVDGNSEAPIRDIVSDHVESSDIDCEVIAEIQSENEGISSARNMGLEIADGSYIAFLDDDDQWYPDKIERQVRLAEEEDADFIHCGIEQRENGHVFSTQVPKVERDLTKELLTGAPIKSPSTVMISSELFDQTGGFDADLWIYEDWDFYIRCSLHTEFAGVQDVLVTRQHHDSQLSGNYQKKLSSAVPRLKRKHRSLARDYDVEERFVATLERFLAASAIKSGQYRSARNHYINAVRNDISEEDIVRLLALSAGGISYRPLQRVRRRLIS
ncbi:glycosyl transferase [Halosimplex carlsbadense 2-9-1]|uniref:Glycosyl transferase n=1 Tax=Halosimplex carlsbadense 2-9-1 TaxID=797114 RepID=M0D4C6_9EURY|nr:glycosyltransferase [Halosimplex carlsbadense]ELZ30310.1 glycosyl transferase [Halosimplex carlsbadense 2-9-1]